MRGATRRDAGAYSEIDLSTERNRRTTMGCLRAVLCVLFPPLSVLDRGCGVILVVTVLTIAGWIPGVIAALLINVLAEG